MPSIGDKLSVHYVETLEDGRQVCNTYAVDVPMTVTIGKHELLPIVEQALCDMFPGEKRTLTLVPALAYGTYDEALVQHVPVNLLPNTEQLPAGERIQIKTRVGQIDAKVVSANADEVVLDCNHEYAGQCVMCEIEFVSEVRETAIWRELHPVGCACGCDKLKAQLNRRLVTGLL